MTDNAQPQKITAETFSANEYPQLTATVQLDHPRPSTPPILPEPPPADHDEASRHHDVNVVAHEQPPHAQAHRQHVIYAPSPHAPRRATSHEPRRRSLPPRRVDEYPLLALSGAEHLGPIPSSAHSLPPLRPGWREHGSIDDDQRQRPRSFGDERHSMSDTTSWIVPEKKRQRREMTVGERLQPTIDAATEERDKAVKRYKMTGYSLNVAIAAQVILGALTTGLGAALSGKSSSIAISILGGASTLAASYLARTRGSNEPEFSLLRAKALNQFLREIHAFKLDHGHEVGHTFDERIDGFRFGLENILGNPAASVAMTDEMAVGPRNDGPSLGTFVPAGLGVGGGVGIGIGAGTGSGIGANGTARGIGPGISVPLSPQQRHQQYPAGKAQGMTSSTFGISEPPLTHMGAPQNQGIREEASLAHSMV